MRCLAAQRRLPPCGLLLVGLLATLAGGCGTPSLLITPVSNPMRLQEITAREGKGWGAKKVAIIEVEGMLVNARAGGLLQPGENSLSLFVEQLRKAAADPDVKAVVLRVNSPGGTVTTSDTMYEQLVRFRQRTGKPVVASFQEVAASGAYYLACASDRIVAHPTSVVGSIGVIFNTFDVSGTLGKIGVRNESIKSGDLKDMGSPFHPLTAEERAVMQGMVDEYYARFVGVVKTSRPQLASSDADLKTATDGRVFSGAQALELGLVDQVGLLEDAVKLAQDLANVPGSRVVMYKRPYGYRGSIYAKGPGPLDDRNVLKLELPGAEQGSSYFATGFYYLWQP